MAGLERVSIRNSPDTDPPFGLCPKNAIARSGSAAKHLCMRRNVMIAQSPFDLPSTRGLADGDSSKAATRRANHGGHLHVIGPLGSWPDRDDANALALW